MPVCCPKGLGCNSRRSDEPCILELCREAAGEEAAAVLALERWTAWEEVLARGCGHAERRFHRHAYERARDAAAAVLLMRLAREHAPTHLAA